MKITFFVKATGQIIPDLKARDWLFVMNDEVYADTFDGCESQEAYVTMGSFIKKRSDLGWISESDIREAFSAGENAFAYHNTVDQLIERLKGVEK